MLYEVITNRDTGIKFGIAHGSKTFAGLHKNRTSARGLCCLNVTQGITNRRYPVKIYAQAFSNIMEHAGSWLATVAVVIGAMRTEKS